MDNIINKSICLLEFRSIAQTFAILNELILGFPVNVFLNRRICPGKYIILLDGNESDIAGCVNYVKDIKNITWRIVNSISSETCHALRHKVAISSNTPIGIFEFTNSCDAIKWADIAIKKSGLIINRIEFTIGLFGKGILVCSGTNASLQDFKNYMGENIKNKNIVDMEIISRPTEELIKLI